MRESYHKEYSAALGRDMEYLVFSADGESAGGKICFAFAPQNGRFYAFKDFGMVETMRPWIEAGKLTVVCPDSIDEETWSNAGGDPGARIRRQEAWFIYLTNELWPAVNPSGGKILTTGCSMGAVHAANFFFRRPDLCDTLIALSGTYNADDFFGGYCDELVYANSPAHFLPNMPADHPWMELYRRSSIILCCGQGPWEDELLRRTHEMDDLLSAKGIPHWADYWGFDVAHDWPWWRKQLPYFLGCLNL